VAREVVQQALAWSRGLPRRVVFLNGTARTVKAVKW
jgi:hypothetical protein